MIDDNCHSLLEKNLTGSSHSASWLSLHWDQNFNAAVTAVLTWDHKALGDLLPKIKNSGLPIADSLAVKIDLLHNKVLFNVAPAVDSKPTPTPTVGGLGAAPAESINDDRDDLTTAS